MRTPIETGFVANGITAVAAVAMTFAAMRIGAERSTVDPMPHAPAAVAAVAAADERAATPSGQPARVAAAAGADAYEVVKRFVDDAAEAAVDSPSAGSIRAAWNAHWRRMPLAFQNAAAPLRERTTNVAIRTSATETQWAMPKRDGSMWAPDARVWNMNEGSYDQRESLIGAPPTRSSFDVTIPPNAKLTFATGLALRSRSAVSFRVLLATRGGGAEKELFAETRSAGEAAGWREASVPLDAYAGQKGVLTFRTEFAREGDAAAVRPSKRARPVAAEGETKEPVSATGTALAVWGNPTLHARRATRVPYNVLFIVVDALRPDVLASFHDDADDAAKRSLDRDHVPLDALLPKVAGLLPNLDDLAAHGVRFEHAYSNGAWTRPGTLAMLTGARSTELGIDPLSWVLQAPAVERYYGSDPPLLPRVVRPYGVVSRAFVNNYFMVGYAPVGVDMGFERVDDHRYRTRDTMAITNDAVEWLRAHHDERFFAFCNYNSPHEPYEAPERFLARVPAPPEGPSDPTVRQYMAEAAKDDEAIGVLIRTLDDLHLRSNTLVVLTADHGETLSPAHAGMALLDHMPVRFHHAVSNYEETTRIPILFSLPGVFDGAKRVTARVRSIDIAPTLLDALGIAVPAAMSGKSMLPLIRGEAESTERVVLTEGRGTRGIIAGNYRLLTREGAATTTLYGERSVSAKDELYDLVADPGERHNLALSNPDVVLEMRARLSAATKNVPTADAVVAEASKPPPPSAATAPSVAAKEATIALLRLRFVAGGQVRRISGEVRAANGAQMTWKATPIGIAPDQLHVSEAGVDFAFETSPDDRVGLDIHPEPDTAPLRFRLYEGDVPLPASSLHAGRFGRLAPELADGLFGDDDRAVSYSAIEPYVDPRRDDGVFVSWNRQSFAPRARGGDTARTLSREGADEMNRLLREWGYAHGP